MKLEAEGIFLWAFEGLQRLVSNHFKFTESDRIKGNREAVKRDNNNLFDFMDSEGYIRFREDAGYGAFRGLNPCYDRIIQVFTLFHNVRTGRMERMISFTFHVVRMYAAISLSFSYDNKCHEKKSILFWCLKIIESEKSKFFDW